MKKKQIVYFTLLILVLSIMAIKSATAEMVVLGGFIVDRSNIIAQVFPRTEQKTPPPTFPDEYKIYVRIGIIGGLLPATAWEPFEVRFKCEDKWDGEKVRKAKDSIAGYINKNNNIDFTKMLSGAGLSGCKMY